MRVVFGALGLSIVVACADAIPEGPPEPTPTGAPQLATSSTVPAKPAIDVTLGRETAFGLQLPRGARARTDTPASKTFSVPLNRNRTVAFLRTRLGEVIADDAPLQTTLEGTVLSSAARPRVIVVVRDVTLTSEVLVRLEDAGE